MGIPLYVICCFSLAAFNICSLCLIFVNLINTCLGVFCLRFILFGALWVSWTWVAISFPILGKFSTIISSSIFSCPFLVFFFWDSYDSNVGASNIVPEVSEVVFISFFLFSSLLHLFPSLYLPPHVSSLLPHSTVGLQSPFISVIALFIIDWFFFISFRSLLNISCISSILVSSLFICSSILFSRLWIILLSLF